MKGVGEGLGGQTKWLNWSRCRGGQSLLWGCPYGDRVDGNARGVEEDSCGACPRAWAWEVEAEGEREGKRERWLDWADGGSGFIRCTGVVTGLFPQARSDACTDAGWRILGDSDGDGDGDARKPKRVE